VSCAHTHACACTQAYTHTHTHTHTYTVTSEYTHTHTRVHKHSQEYTHTNKITASTVNKFWYHITVPEFVTYQHKHTNRSNHRHWQFHSSQDIGFWRKILRMKKCDGLNFKGFWCKNETKWWLVSGSVIVGLVMANGLYTEFDGHG
jgi:hypothetical protein